MRCEEPSLYILCLHFAGVGRQGFCRGVQCWHFSSIRLYQNLLINADLTTFCFLGASNPVRSWIPRKSMSYKRQADKANSKYTQNRFQFAKLGSSRYSSKIERWCTNGGIVWSVSHSFVVLVQFCIFDIPNNT